MYRIKTSWDIIRPRNDCCQETWFRRIQHGNLKIWCVCVCVRRRDACTISSSRSVQGPGSWWGLCRGVCPKMVIKCHEFMGESPFVIGTYHDLGITSGNWIHGERFSLSFLTKWTRHILDIYSIQVPCEFWWQHDLHLHWQGAQALNSEGM